MAKLPDHIDKTDKKAVAAYFIKQREMQEVQKYYDDVMLNSGKDYVDIYGDFNRYNTEPSEYLVSQGYTVEHIAHLTWRITKPQKTS